MTTLSIIGTGTMATAIGGVASAGGHSVEYHGRDKTGGSLAGDIVVLALPYPSVGEVVAAYRDQLAGKVVVDITNPVDFTTFDALVVPADGSAAAQLAEALPDSHVLKAFNTTLAASLNGGTLGGAPTAVLIAGDDADAKAALSQVVRDGGLLAVDAGSLRRARELEALGFLQMTLAVGEKISWTGGFALVG